MNNKFTFYRFNLILNYEFIFPHRFCVPSLTNSLNTRTKHCIFTPMYRILIYAVLGGEVAVPCNSQSALARLNPFLRLSVCKVCLLHVALTVGSCAMGTHEPCQVRKEAALSGFTHVPRGSLT